MTRLGTDDLAAVDTLIAVGIGGSRAEILRWAVSRIREHPAYAQLQDRVQTRSASSRPSSDRPGRTARRHEH